MLEFKHGCGEISENDEDREYADDEPLIMVMFDDGHTDDFRKEELEILK